MSSVYESLQYIEEDEDEEARWSVDGHSASSWSVVAGEWPSPTRRPSSECLGETEEDGTGEAVWWSTSVVPTRKRGISDAPALHV